MAASIPLSHRRPCDIWRVVLALLALLMGGLCPGQEVKLRVTFRADKESVRTVAINPEGTILATGGSDAVVRLWDATTRKELAALRHDDPVTCLAFTPDGKTLAAGGRGRVKDSSYDAVVGAIKLWDVTTTRERASLTGYEPLSASEKFRGVITGESRWPFRGHRGPVLAVAISPDGKTLASGGDDNHVILWDLASGKVRRDLQGHSGDLRSLSFSPDGGRLVSGGDNSVILWDMAGSGEGATLGRHDGGTNCVAFSPDGRSVASGGWGRVKLWDPFGRAEKTSFETPCQMAVCLAYSPTGDLLAWGGTDEVLRLWGVAARREVAAVRGHSDQVLCVVFSPDGRSLVRGTARVW